MTSVRVDAFREHIPGAVFFDLFKDVQNTAVLPRNVPEVAVFEKNAQSAGVNSDSHVIVYDTEGKCGYFLGSRAWWTFQVSAILLVWFLFRYMVARSTWLEFAVRIKSQ